MFNVRDEDKISFFNAFLFTPAQLVEKTVVSQVPCFCVIV